MKNHCQSRLKELKKKLDLKRLLNLAALGLVLFISSTVRAQGVSADLETILFECKDKEKLFTTILPVTPPAVGATLQRMGIADYCEYVQILVDMKLFLEKGKLTENLLSITDKRTAENLREMKRFHSFMTSLQDPKDGKFRPEALSQMKNRRKVYGYFKGLGRRISRRQKVEEIEAQAEKNKKLSELAQKRSLLNARNECLVPEESEGKKTDYEKIYEKDIRPYERANVYHGYRSNALFKALDGLGNTKLISMNPGMSYEYKVDLRALTNVAALKADFVIRRENKEEIKYQKFVMDYDGKVMRDFLNKYNKFWGAYVNDNSSYRSDESKFDPSYIPELQMTEEEYFSMGEEDRRNLEKLRAQAKVARKDQSASGYPMAEKIDLFERLVKMYANSRSMEETAKAKAFSEESSYLKEPIFNVEDGNYISKAQKPCDQVALKSEWDRAKIDLESKKLEAEYKEIQAQAAFTKKTRRNAHYEVEKEFIRKQNLEIESGDRSSQKDIFNNIKLLNGAINK